MLSARLAAYLVPVRILGSGTYGEVWLAVSKTTGTMVAVKISTGEKGLQYARNEIDTLKKLAHPSILPVLDSDEESERVYLVTSYVEGDDLLTFLRARSGIPEALARGIFRQLLSAIDYAHNHGFLHRDVKLENILIDVRANKVFLIDWGFSGPWTPGKLQSGSFGSLHYSAPEICRAAPYCGPEVDIWSLGVVLFALLAGKLPFRGDTNRRIHKRILVASPSYPSSFSDETFALLNAMLNPDRALRATVPQILSSPFNTTPRSMRKEQEGIADHEQGEKIMPSHSPETLRRR